MASIYWPENNITYRGGGILKQYQSFYQKDVKYRAPMFLSTSGIKAVTHSFMSRIEPPSEPILWIFHFDEEKRCVNVNYLERSMAFSPLVEDEFLFSSYSVFTVIDFNWQDQPTWKNPHEVRLKVAPDSKEEPEDLPLAYWC